MSDQNALTITVLQKTAITPKLFSFRTTRPQDFRFTAGQFVRLGIVPKNTHDSAIFRAYSVASSPYDEFLDFFSVVVPDGAFTSQLQYLNVGDTLYLNPEPFGFLTLDRFLQPAPKNLWLLATGTGVAPFLSILQDLTTWQNYQNIVLVYSVSYADELAFLDKIHSLQQDFAPLVENSPTFKFVPVVTREFIEGALNQRLPILITSGILEQKAALTFNPDTDHVMLCGNPQMVDDTKEALKNKGLTMNRRSVGNIAVENYW